MNKIQKNKLFYIPACALRSISVLCATGTLMQTFLSVVGFSESQIYLHATLVQAVNVSIILLCSHFADCKRPFLRSVWVQVAYGLLFLFYLPFCLRAEASVMAFVLLLGVTFVQNVFYALNTVLEYKIPYYLYTATDYRTVQAVLGVIIGLSNFGIGELLNYLRTVMSYERLMLFAFILSAAFCVTSGLFSFFFKALTKEEFSGKISTTDDSASETKNVAVKTVSVLEMFRRPIFYLLVPANLLRGFATGAVTVFATVAITLGFDSTALAPRMVSLSAIAHLIACFLFGIASRYLSPRVSILVCSAFYLLIPLCLMGSPTLFLIAYTLIFFGKSVIDVAVPSLLMHAVDVEIAGPYNAWRMILHFGGTMLATAIAPFLSPAALLFSVLGCGLLSGVMFFALRILRKASPTFLRGKPHLLRRANKQTQK